MRTILIIIIITKAPPRHDKMTLTPVFTTAAMKMLLFVATKAAKIKRVYKTKTLF